MKKMSIYSLILLGLFNNINSMEESHNKRRKEAREEERNLGGLEALPNEIKYEIIKSVIEDNINSWGDIFNFDNESLKNDLDRVRLISKDFTAFGKEELEDLIKKLKDKRFEYLKENIKDQYKGLSEIELNERLTNLLNNMPYTTKERSKENLQECVKLIIAGANINATDKHGKSALMLAARKGQAEIVKLLIYMGASINATDYYGDTALMYAASYDNTEVVKLLIKMHADINVTNNQGGTALMLAKLYGSKDIVELLESKGAK